MAAANKTAIITGTAKAHGIGRGCARKFLQAGYKVVGVDIKPQEDCAADQVLRGHADSFRFVLADLTQAESGERVLAEARSAFGPSVRVLVNNAGIADPHMPEAPSEALSHWHRIINTNLSGPFLMSQAVLPHMPAGQSAIIHIASTRAKQSEPHTEAYCAAKAGLLGLTHAQATSLAGRVRVNAVLPGWISTGSAEELRPEDHEWHPAGRVGLPEDVAEVCLFLADPSRAGFITGQEFVVDGGVSRKMVYPE